MSQLALYRAWRPQTFDEVVAQTQVVYPLKQAVISQDIGHAYLFAGTRGTGKTSLAKIFAKAVNCLDPHNGNPCNKCSICEGVNNGSLLDVQEIDAASHNSVDNIRRLTEEVLFMPTQAKYKVYIIDEVHMLSQGAFNALLKTLEEPPEHAIFILATTELQRIPATILSRCQRFEFRRIPLADIETRLRKIAEADNLEISDEALNAIARLGDGALRDAISLLDQCQAGMQGRIEQSDVYNMAGIVQDEFLAKFAEDVFNRDLSAVLGAIDEVQMSGRDIQRFLQDFLRYLRDLLVVQLSPEAEKLLDAGNSDPQALKDISKITNQAQIMGIIKRLSALNSELRWSSDPKTSLELAFINELMTTDTVITVVEKQATTTVHDTGENKITKSEIVNKIPPAPPIHEATELPSVEEKSETPAKDKLETIIQDKSDTETEEKQESLLKEEKAANSSENPAPSPSRQAAAENLDKQSLWKACLQELQKQNQFVIVMLLKPASVQVKDTENGCELIIDYKSSEAKAHYQALKREENFQFLEGAAQKVFILNKLAAPQVIITLDGHEDLPEEENVNPQEPLWVRKLRHAGQVHQMEVKIPGIDDVEEQNHHLSNPTFPDTALPQDDTLPY